MIVPKNRHWVKSDFLLSLQTVLVEPWFDVGFTFIELDDGPTVDEGSIVQEKKLAGDSAIDRVENLGVQSAPKKVTYAPTDDVQTQIERQERFEITEQAKAECRPEEGKHMHGQICTRVTSEPCMMSTDGFYILACNLCLNILSYTKPANNPRFAKHTC